MKTIYSPFEPYRIEISDKTLSVCNKLNIQCNLAITDTSIFDTFYKILEG